MDGSVANASAIPSAARAVQPAVEFACVRFLMGEFYHAPARPLHRFFAAGSRATRARCCTAAERINLMDALRRRVAAGKHSSARTKKGRTKNGPALGRGLAVVMGVGSYCDGRH